MPNFKFVDFSCNLLQVDNFVANKEACLVLYPTQNNANLAQAYSQSCWQLENTLYLAIDSFKEMVLVSDKTFLEDDKRVIVLYRLLTEDDKLFFKVTDFFDFIKLANKIFKLFEELAEESIEFSSLCQLLEDANSTLFPWQIDYYERIYKLIIKFKDWLANHQFNDKIFNLRADNISLDYFKDYTHVYVINQFYYSNFERTLLTKLEEAGKELTLVYQLPEEFVDKTNFNAKLFNYRDLEALTNQQPKLELIIDRNSFTMMNSLCRIVSEEKITQVIDRDFYETPYAQLLSHATFDIKFNKAIINTELYQVLDIIQHILESLDFYNQQQYLPIHVLIRAFLNKPFTKYFQIHDSDSIVEELYKFHDKGILYIDSKASIINSDNSVSLKASLQRIIIFIRSITKIRTISALIALFDAENGIILDKLCSPFDLKYSNIKEVVYTELANLKSFTYNKLIDKWSDLSDKAEYIIIYKLFLDGLKAKTIKYTQDKKVETPKKIRVNSLLDTRNNTYDSLVFLNMIEGVLPTKRTTQFLFNEKQREILTLKNYEEIRLREKYYFQRLVLSSKKCYFIGIENLDEDISLSSFLEELPLNKPQGETRQADRGYSDLFNHSENSSQPTLNDDFWSVKLSSQEFCHNSTIMKLSYTRLESLINNPLCYLIRDWAKVPEISIITEATLDRRFVGIFAQNYVNHIIARIKDNFINQEVFYKFQFMSKERLSKIYDSFLQTYPNKDYYIPHNYSYSFLSKILKPALVEGMQTFFHFVMHSKLDLSEKKIDLIPEEGFRYNKSLRYKSFIAETENDYKLGIAVTGDADLRIEEQENKSKVVIDFKTGTFSKDQLALYQFIYYWDDIACGNKIKSGIYQILKQEWNPQNKPADVTISQLKTKVIDVLNEIAERGFSLPKSLTKAKIYDKITRADLALRR